MLIVVAVVVVLSRVAARHARGRTPKQAMSNVSSNSSPSITVERLFEREIGASPLRGALPGVVPGPPPDSTLVSALAAERNARRATMERYPEVVLNQTGSVWEQPSVNVAALEAQTQRRKDAEVDSVLEYGLYAVGGLLIIWGLYKIFSGASVATSAAVASAVATSGSPESLAEHLGQQLQQTFTPDEIRALFRTRLPDVAAASATP